MRELERAGQGGLVGLLVRARVRARVGGSVVLKDCLHCVFASMQSEPKMGVDFSPIL